MDTEKQKVEMPDENLNLDPVILAKAKDGDSFAQLDMGKAFYSDPNLNDNCEKAFHWLTLSAKQGNMEAQFRLGDLHAFGQGVEKNESAAYDWYVKSAVQGYPKALTRLHNLYHTEQSMYCRGQRDSTEAEWATEAFRAKNKIRELNEYRVQQLISKLTNIKEYFTKLLTTCREQISDESEDEDVKQDAYLKLGFLYQHGYGIRKIKSRAVEFYTLAAERENGDAEYNLGHIYHHSPRMLWNYRKAFNWYTKSAEKGHAYAQNGLAFLYLKGLGIDVNYLEAIDLYTKAAENRHINAMISLGTIFRKGEIIKQDCENAARWYKKAVAEGSTVAQNCLESLCSNEKIASTEDNAYIKKESPNVFSKKGLCSRLRSDITELAASPYLDKLKTLAMNAMKGDGYAMFEIGMKYHDGDGFVQNKDVAFKWIKNAAKSGVKSVEYALAKMYKDGDCIEQNYHKASIWYKKVAEKRDSSARFDLGVMYHNGLGVRKDSLEASKWYTFSAEKENSDAQCYLGILRLYGEGLREDVHDALKYFYVSAKQKNPQAVYRLGMMYENGYAVKSNFEIALVLFKKAAQLGSLDARMKLAKMYDDDENQSYDKKSAFEYYGMAANSGSPEAKYKLAIMYLDGKGVNQNLIQAYRLFKESSDLGYPNSMNLFDVPIDYSRTNDIDYSRVAAMFRLVCEDGMESLEYNLGFHYSNNVKFVYGREAFNLRANRNFEKTWYRIAAEKGVSEACYRLAVINEEENNIDKAVDYYEQAYRTGNADATYQLACMSLDGNGYPQDFHKAFFLFQEASNKGHKEAYNTLSTLSDNDQNRRFELIKQMLQVSAESGNVISQYKLGEIALNSKPSESNTQEAIKWMSMASKEGFILASHSLAVLFETNNVVENSDQEIIRLYELAAYKGYVKALFRLAQIFHFGERVEENYLKAFGFYLSAARQGYQPAQLAIDVTTESVWKNVKNKLKNDNTELLCFNYILYLYMWKHVAEKGNFDLQYKLGIVYENKGGDTNMAKAAKWYLKAAKDSHKDSLYRLGRLYELGLGVNQNYTTAIELYERAHKLNNSQAMYRLALIYQESKEIQSDFGKAYNYYKKAAEKGNSYAQYKLGELINEGKFIPKNKLEALEWYSKAASQGNVDAENWLATHYYELHNYDAFHYRKLVLLTKIIKHSQHTHQSNNSFLGSVYYQLGLMYYHGYGTIINYIDAWSCFNKSATLHGDDRAKSLINIKYDSTDILTKDSYLKKLEMLEVVAEKNSVENKRTSKTAVETELEQLSVEDIYELGLIYYHGVSSNLKGFQVCGSQSIIQSDLKKASKFFRMITKKEYPEYKDYYMHCSYYLGMVYFVDIKRTNDSSKTKYYFNNAFDGGSTDSQIFLEYMNNKNNEEAIFEKVFEWHKNVPNSYHAKLIYNIGWMYTEGFGTSRDYIKAVKYYETAARQSYTDAYMSLGYIYNIGLGVEENPTTAMQWYAKAANQNNIVANNILGNAYFDGRGFEKDYRFAFKYYKIAADQGDSNAQNQLGTMYENGYGVEQNYAIAVEWYTKAANQNNDLASFNLGAAYYYGQGVEKDYRLAFKYYEIAADRGDSDAQNQVGIMYENGYGVDQSYTTAVEWYTKAANQNNGFANSNLGDAFFYGEGVQVDYKLAHQYYSVAADKRDSDAQNQLGMMYTNGYGVEQNYAAAIDWYTKAANQDNVAANYNLGKIYYYGQGVEKDYSLALQYFKNAADQGDSNAQSQLGIMYENGHGVEQSYATAVEWYTKAANQNSVAANYNLGKIYYYGQGVEKDYSLALQYFKNAADQGDSNAQSQLGIMYENGHGVEQNDITANEWYKKAADENDATANYKLGSTYFYRKNSDLAFQHLKIAADSGHSNAQIQLSAMYYQYLEKERNHETTIHLFTQASNEDYNLRVILGEIYQSINGEIQKASKGFESLDNASENDNGKSFAFRSIGLLFEHGDGVEKSFEKALYYYKESANKNNKGAYYNLALLYYYGKGVDKNYNIALEWLNRVVEGEPESNRHVFVQVKNNTEIELSTAKHKQYTIVDESLIYGEAHCFIGLMHKEGQGAEQSNEKASYHFKIARSQGVERAQQYLD